MRPFPPCPLAHLAAGLAAIALVVGCGADASDSKGPTPPTFAQPLTAAQQRGQGLALSEGCVSCHGIDFTGGVGPTWIDLAGSTVALADGTTVVADDAYLARAITDPKAEVRADAKVVMPTNQLTDAQVADLVAFFHALAGS
jgi:cytochrome c oxidase subunit 2